MSTAVLNPAISHEVLLELAFRYKLRSLLEAVVVRTGQRSDRVRLSAVAERCAVVMKVAGGTLWCGKVRRAMRELGWGADLVRKGNVAFLKGAKLK